MAGYLSITFDDGFASVYSLALPELERRGITATVFVISDLIGKSYLGQPVLSKRMLQTLVAEKWEIGSHTRSHPKLTELSEFQVNAELRESKRRLENVTCAKIAGLAYPYGAFNYVTKALAAKYYTFARAGSCYPPLRVNSLFPRDLMEIRSVSACEHAFYLPFHLFENYLAAKVGFRSGGGKPHNLNRESGWINHPGRRLEARLVEKWLRKLRKNQWLILSFHDVSSNESLSNYTIPLGELREIAKAGAENADVSNFSGVVQRREP